MKLKQITLATSLLMGLAPFVKAQETTENNPIVELSAGVKTFYLDRMGFEPNESLSAVLQTLTRNMGTRSVGDYNIMVDGEICHESSILLRTLVSQVECIQVITDGNSGYSVGSAGNINIVHKAIEDGTHGRIDFSMDTKANLFPAGSVTHKSGKWTMWANALGNISELKSDVSYEYITDYSDLATAAKSSESGSASASTHKNRSGIANIGIKYKDEKNTLSFNISNNWNPIKSDVERLSYDGTLYPDNKYVLSTSFCNENTKYINNNFFASVDFKHIFNDKASLTAILSEKLNNNPYWVKELYGEAEYPSNGIVYVSVNNTSLSGYTNYYAPHHHGSTTQLNTHADFSVVKNLNLTAGIYGAWNRTNKSAQDYYSEHVGDAYTFAPYALASYKLGDFAFNVGERVAFGNVNYEMTLYPASLSDVNGEKFDMDNSNTLSVTNASVCWMPTANHQLLASYKRLRNIVSEPYCMVVLGTVGTNESFTIRDNNLNNDVLDLTYAYIGKNISASLSATYRDYGNDYSYPILGNNTHIDSGSYDNFKYYGLSASAVGTFGIFSINADVNYMQMDREYLTSNDANNSTYHYWDIRVNPVVSLPCGIKASATAMYTYTKNPKASNLPDAIDDLWCTLRVSKSWKHIDAFVKWENVFHNKLEWSSRTEDSWRTSNLRFSQDDHISQVTFGASYKF